MTGRRRRVLFIARGAPPSPLPGARRIEGMSRYLEELGYDVTVLASIMFGRGPQPWGPSRVVRTRDAVGAPLLELRRKRRQTRAASGLHAEPASAPITKNTDAEMRRSTLSSLLAPDVAAVTWLPFALPRAFQLHARHHFDCVITSAPPPSTHLIGLALHARGLPWLVDVRDGWTFEQPDRPPLAPPAAWLDRRLERLVMTRADVVTTVTPRLTRDVADRFDARAVTITNGFDPAEEVTESPRIDGLLSPDRHSLVYTGSLYPSRFRPFARALAQLQRERPELESRLEVVIIGARWQGSAEVADEEGVRGVRWVPPLPRADVLRIQRQADSLLVLLEPERPGLATTKLFEYFAAERPILVVGPAGDAADILANAGGGFTVAPTLEGVATGIDKLLGGEEPPAGRSGRGVYTYPQLAAQMAEQIEAAIARHGR